MAADTESLDEPLMRRALELAARGRGKASPNPMVGCVFAGEGGVMGEGFHAGPGRPHAEIEAIAAAGDCAGATLYVNLEPCNHTGRTGPCAPAVHAARIARVVYGAGDPIDGHRGGGRWLERQGVEVTRGVLARECEELNRAFFHWARNKTPQIVVKAASSLDGRAAMASGESQWITSRQARAHGRRLRAELDAIAVGIGTILADDPRLTARSRGARDPIRVVVDSALRTPPAARVLPDNSESSARCIIATADRAPVKRERRLVDAGAEIWRLGPTGSVDLEALLDRLGAESITSVLVEGGPTLVAELMYLADELHLYLAPIALGDPARGWLGDTDIVSLDEAWQGRIHRVEPIGPDLLIVVRFRAG